MDSERVAKINECIRKIKAGDRDAVVTLHSLMGRTLYFVALRYLKNKDDAEDLVQDFWLNIESYAKKARFLSNGFAYLIKIIENSAKTKLRDRARIYKDIFARSADADVASDTEKSAATLIRREKLESSIRRAMEVLDEEEFVCINMLFFEERCADEVAEELNLTKPLLEAVKRGAIEKMKEIFTQDGWDNDDIK